MKSAEQWLEPDSVNALVPTSLEGVTHGDVVKLIIKAAQAEAHAAGEAKGYAAGQKRGHEDAAVECLSGLLPKYERQMCEAFAEDIRNLPIQPLPESQPTQDKGE